MSRSRRVVRTLQAIGLSMLLAGAASGADDAEVDGTDPAASRLVTGFAAISRPAGMAEASVGLLTLPGAEVCVERGAGCSQGDVVLALEGSEMYRANKRWAFGAGIVVGLIPTAHPDPPPQAVPRDHTRSYFMFEGMLRYYPYVGKDLEAWVGVMGGLVVVNDRFDVVDETDERALLGGRGVTIGTEGGSLGLAGGLAYGLSEHWSLLGSLRLSQWFLPKEPERDPLGSEASLTGRNSAVMLGVGIAYRASL